MSYYGGLAPVILGVCWAFFPIATMLLGLRVYTYFYIVKSRGGWALIWASVAYALAIPSVVLFTLCAVYGLGNHLKIVELSPHLPDALLYEWVAANTVSFSVGFVKLSALTFLLDIQGPTYRLGRWALYTAVSINFILYTVLVPLMFLVCEPIKKLWNPTAPGQCEGEHRVTVLAILNGAWGAATDLLLALYPVIIVHNLQIRLKLKLLICFLMGLGVFTAVCSLAKTVQFKKLAESSTGSDSTYAITPLIIWAVMEMWIGFLATSVAPLWPLFKRSRIYRSKRFGRSLSTYFNVRHSFTRHKFPHRSASDHAPDVDDGDLGSVNFQRLASEEAINHPDGIELTTEVTVTSGKVSQTAGAHLGNKSFGGACA